ncbi:MAG: transcriptional regulator NrdR [Candidatus Omnitrophica bacterium]|nr:transcriptional regulator NrdR [Candidatus Omnitrophota bacterium]
MKCPFCNHNEDKVIDSRETGEGAAIRRRRECLNCAKRFTTYEYVEKTPLMVIKKDGRREPFSRQKILSGLVKACEKRPVSMENLEKLVVEVEAELQKKFEQEVESRYVGEMVIDKLSKVDDVAYVRFASVYRQFKDINQFMRELRDVLGKRISNAHRR